MSYGWVEETLHVFLASKLYGHEWSGLVRSATIVGVTEEGGNPPPDESTTPTVPMVSSHFIDWAKSAYISEDERERKQEMC